ncbi:LamG domain-containing protein, partial [Bacillus pumilus]
EELTTYTTAFFGAKDGDHWVSLVPRGAVANNTMVWSGSTSWYDGATGLTIPTGEWSHLVFSVENGTLTVYVNGVQKFKGANFPDWFTGTKASF